jgi:hypothetical protein
MEMHYDNVHDTRTYPEKVESELRALRIEINRLRDEMEYLQRIVHKYINVEEQHVGENK